MPSPGAKKTDAGSRLGYLAVGTVAISRGTVEQGRDVTTGMESISPGPAVHVVAALCKTKHGPT
jgi:hypothetical protein